MLTVSKGGHTTSLKYAIADVTSVKPTSSNSINSNSVKERASYTPNNATCWGKFIMIGRVCTALHRIHCSPKHGVGMGYKWQLILNQE